MCFLEENIHIDGRSYQSNLLVLIYDAFTLSHSIHQIVSLYISIHNLWASTVKYEEGIFH